MSREERARRSALVATATIALLAVAMPGAALAKRDPSRDCRRALGRSVDISRSSTALVAAKGSISSGTFVVFACLYSKGKPYKLPGQDGGKSKRLYLYTLGKRYLGYGTLSIKATPSLSSVTVFDVKTGKRASQSPAFPGATRSSLLDTLVLKKDGTAAWVGSQESTDYAVFLLRRGGSAPTQLAAGTDIDPGSLKRAAGGSQITWMQAGKLMSAPFG